METLELLAEPHRFEFGGAEQAWGGDHLNGTSSVPRRNECFCRGEKSAVEQVLQPLVAAGRVALCGPVAFELGFAARGRDDHETIQAMVTAYPAIPVNDADHRRTLEIQSLLARRGEHRALSLVDALVAAVAEPRELIILRDDADFEMLRRAIGLRHE